MSAHRKGHAECLPVVIRFFNACNIDTAYYYSMFGVGVCVGEILVLMTSCDNRRTSHSVIAL